MYLTLSLVVDFLFMSCCASTEILISISGVGAGNEIEKRAVFEGISRNREELQRGSGYDQFSEC